MAALAADLDAVRVAVQAAVEKQEGSWDDGDWSVFVVDVVSFLLGKHKKQSFVVAAAVGLIVYGVNTEEELQGVAGQPPDDEKFKRQLADKYGVPAAICDMLFAKYVARSEGQPKMPMRAPEDVAKEYLDGVLNGKQLARPAFEMFSPKGAFKSFAREGVKVPQRIDQDKPYLLMYEVQNAKVRESSVYRHIESTAPLGCSALYATSGAGKTRSVFEFL